jgi:hypothetical protein
MRLEFGLTRDTFPGFRRWSLYVSIPWYWSKRSPMACGWGWRSQGAEQIEPVNKAYCLTSTRIDHAPQRVFYWGEVNGKES